MDLVCTVQIQISNSVMKNLCLNFLTMDLVCKKYIDLFNTFLRLEILLFIKQCPLKFMSGNI